jgi:hypothetical protein
VWKVRQARVLSHFPPQQVQGFYTYPPLVSCVSWTFRRPKDRIFPRQRVNIEFRQDFGVSAATEPVEVQSNAQLPRSRDVETIAHDTPSEAEVLPIPYSLSPPQD